MIFRISGNSVIYIYINIYICIYIYISYVIDSKGRKNATDPEEITVTKNGNTAATVTNGVTTVYINQIAVTADETEEDKQITSANYTASHTVSAVNIDEDNYNFPTACMNPIAVNDDESQSEDGSKL